MTTLTQSDLDDLLRESTKLGASAFCRLKAVEKLRDHIAQLTAENARKKAKKRQFPSLCNPKQNAESLLQYYAKQGVGDMALLQALEGLLIEFVSNEARIAELETERDELRGVREECRLANRIAANERRANAIAQDELAKATARIAELEAQSSAQFVDGMFEAARIAQRRFGAGSPHQYASNECSAAILAEAALKGEGR